MNKTFNIKNLIEDGAELRERPVNYINVAQGILDTYPHGLAHGLQKDAIQNGWDACIKKNPKFVSENWMFKFELIEGEENNLLVLEDFGTVGLTGKMTSADIQEDQEPPEEERWARWESLAFAKGNEESLGARGQGKMIPIAASKDHAIFYDSLREDGTYRAGVTQATTKRCPIKHYDEDRAKSREIVGTESINHQGTRVIIINPVDELISSIKSGEFSSFIGETWWPIIHKYGAKIIVKHGGKETTIITPDSFPLKDKVETQNFKKWVKSEMRFQYENEQFFIKHLEFGCDLNSSLNDMDQGVSVFRGGMKVASVIFPDFNLRKKVYGFVEVDEAADKQLRQIELPNHYGFKNAGIWRKLKDIIEKELEAFGNQKLGTGIDIRAAENDRRNAAENKAINILRVVTKGWNFPHHGKGSGGADGPVEPPSIKDIGMVVQGMIFPNEGNIPRLNYEEILEGFDVKIFNKTEQAVPVDYKVNILSGDRLLFNVDEKELELDAKSNLTTEKYKIVASKITFDQPGEYKIRFTLVNKATNKREDEITRKIWIETDPELKGPFDVKRIDFKLLNKEEMVNQEWFIENKGDNNYILWYNIDHPVYLDNDENESKLARNLSELFCMGALQLLIDTVKNNDIGEQSSKNLPFDLEKILSGDPKQIYLETAKAISTLRSEIYKLV